MNTKTGKILKPCLSDNGYLTIAPCANGKPKTIKIHQLVAKAFIPNPNNLPFIDHKNNNKTDNRV